MSIYNLPNNKKKDSKIKTPLNILIMCAFFVLSVIIGYALFNQEKANDDIVQKDEQPSKEFLEENGLEIGASEYIAQTTHEKRVMDVVKKSSPSVVSIVVKKKQGKINKDYDFYNFYFPDFFEMPEVEESESDELIEVGAGTGFIVSEDGIILTNKHVVSDEDAVYSIITNDSKEYDVEILDINPVQDIGVIKVIDTDDKFKALKLGDSSSIQLAQSAIAIGNTLGEFTNTVSVGVISGLGRRVSAQDNSGNSELLEGVIQTDAAISQGNSGGPLLNLKGEVIGINTAISMSGENIGFAIPINKAKRDLEQVLEKGEISYPFIGIKYVVINEDIQKQENLPVDYGALIVIPEEGEDSSIVLGSPADKAQLKEGSIILELDGEKITENNTLVKMIEDYFPGDVVKLKVLKNGEEKIVELELGNWNDYNL